MMLLYSATSGAVPVCSTNTPATGFGDPVSHPDLYSVGRQFYHPAETDYGKKTKWFNYAIGYEGFQGQGPAVNVNVMIKTMCTTNFCVEANGDSSDGDDDDSARRLSSDSTNDNSGKVWTKPALTTAQKEMWQSTNGVSPNGGNTDYPEEIDANYLFGVKTWNEAGYDADTGVGGAACCFQRGTDGNDCAFPLSKEQWYDTCKPYIGCMEKCGSQKGVSILDGVACNDDDDMSTD